MILFLHKFGKEFCASRRDPTMGNAPSSSSEGERNDGNAPFGGGGGSGGPSMNLLNHRITGGGSNYNVGRQTSSLLGHLPVISFRSGSLGLTRTELDSRCQSSGLYPSCEWDTKHIRRLISNGQIAARLKGSDCRNTKTDRECPICFMYYPETNETKCCNATVCTECYLQVKTPKDKSTCCPFCNNPKLSVSVQGCMDDGDVARREEEEQRVIEATIKSRVMELNGECSSSPAPPATTSSTPDSPSSLSFGSSLAHYNRSRTYTGSSSNNSGSRPGTPTTTPTRNNTGGDGSSSAMASKDDLTSSIQLLAMSPDDRRSLESEMRAQLSHETHRRMEIEAEEARMRHAREWYSGTGGTRSRVREARLAELTNLLERMSAMRRGGGGEGLDGAAGSGGSDSEGDDTSLMARDGEERDFGRAPPPSASLSRLLRAMENSANVSGGGGANRRSLEELMRLEAAFFLGMDEDPRLRHRGAVSGRSYGGGNEESNGNNNERDVIANLFGLGGRPPSSIRSPTRSVGRSRFNRMGGSSTHIDTVELLMRGVSEEEQLAMAIAMSMQDAQQQQQSQSTEGDQQDVAPEENIAAQDEGHGHESEEEATDNSSSSSESSSSGSSSSDSSEQRSHDGSVSLGENEEEVIFSSGEDTSH